MSVQTQRRAISFGGDGGQAGQALHACKSAWLPATLLRRDPARIARQAGPSCSAPRSRIFWNTRTGKRHDEHDEKEGKRHGDVTAMRFSNWAGALCCLRSAIIYSGSGATPGAAQPLPDIFVAVTR